MDQHYEGSSISFLESVALSKFLQICIAFFTIYGGSNIWQGLEYMGKSRSR